MDMRHRGPGTLGQHHIIIKLLISVEPFRSSLRPRDPFHPTDPSASLTERSCNSAVRSYSLLLHLMAVTLVTKQRHDPSPLGWPRPLTRA